MDPRPPTAAGRVLGEREREGDLLSSETDAKLAINGVIWTYGKPNMTLAEAEKLAVEFLGKLIH